MSKIVTRSVIRDADGNEHQVHQLGGTVNGIGMRVIPGTKLLTADEQVQVATRTIPGGSDSQPVEQVLWRNRPGVLKSVRTTNKTGAELYWSSNCVFITYDAAGTTHIAGDAEFATMDAVFDNWQTQMSSCAYMSFTMDPPASGQVGLDSVNLVKFREDDWCPPDAQSPADCYSPGAAGLTTLFFIDDASSKRNGEILDADIELNAVNFSISINGSSLGPNQCFSDLANTLTHEVGHLLGLDHTCWVPDSPDDPQPVDNLGNLVPRCTNNLPARITEATMYNYQECGETKKASLETDDVQDGVCLIYPIVDDPGECKVPQRGGGGGCASSPGSTTWLFGLALALMMLLMPRRRLGARPRRRSPRR